MKLLISTYACSPRHGSECAVGWNWTTEAHRLGHEVWALASPVHRADIEAACRDDPGLAGISFVYPEVAGWRLKPGIEPKWERTYNLLWQRAALRHASQLQQFVQFDAIHHLTWGGVRAPTFLGTLGPPLIIGPIGGGETTPAPLRDGFHMKARITEWLRDVSSQTIAFNPMVRPGLDSAAAIFVRTSDTYRLLPAAMQKKSRVFIELGLRQEQISPRQALPPGPPRLLFVGRLLYWKGVHIAIQALAKLVTRMPGASLTIVGSGPEEARLKRDVAAQGLTDSVKFIPWLPRAEMANVYDSHDMLVFPSLHDSGGTVVLEAISRGLPVICLDLGGPRHIVTPGGGVVVGTQGLNTAQVAQAMAQELYALFQNPARLGALSAGANARAGQFVLSDRVRSFYGQVDEFIRVPHANGAMPTHVPFLVPSANM